ncbi:hypothetical protein GGR57DRAFT_521087 [Xylariaceae sp. FL1272]|nr:hypothetical protein GGR57DRAFT_521087 [Xylariaceae sp. FL1272]
MLPTIRFRTRGPRGSHPSRIRRQLPSTGMTYRNPQSITTTAFRDIHIWDHLTQQNIDTDKESLQELLREMFQVATTCVGAGRHLDEGGNADLTLLLDDVQSSLDWAEELPSRAFFELFIRLVEARHNLRNPLSDLVTNIIDFRKASHDGQINYRAGTMLGRDGITWAEWRPSWILREWRKWFQAETLRVELPAEDMLILHLNELGEREGLRTKKFPHTAYPPVSLNPIDIKSPFREDIGDDGVALINQCGVDVVIETDTVARNTAKAITNHTAMLDARMKKTEC